MAIAASALLASPLVWADDPPEATAVVTLGLPMIVGDLDIAPVFAAVEGSLPALRACFGPGYWDGEVLLRTVVDASGTVTESAVTTTTLEVPEVEACLAKAMEGARFPEAEARDEVTVVLPLTIYPE